MGLKLLIGLKQYIGLRLCVKLKLRTGLNLSMGLGLRSESGVWLEVRSEKGLKMEVEVGVKAAEVDASGSAKVESLKKAISIIARRFQRETPENSARENPAHSKTLG